MNANVNKPGNAPRMTRAVAVAAIKAGAKCCTRLSVRKARLAGVPGVR